MNYSEYEPLSNKKWKAITYDWDVLTTYSNSESRMYCLTPFQANWLLANVEYMRWATRQVNCPCTPEELNNLAGELSYNLMSCIDFQPYQLQYLYEQGIADNLNNFETLYDSGGIPELNPNTPTDYYSGDDSDERLDALCTACYLYCYSYSADWVSRAQTALGIVVVVGLASSVSIVGGVIASVLVGGLAYITSIALNAFNDTDALDNVVCCMKSGLDGQAVNQSNFENSLNGCSFDVGSNEAIIRDIIASDLGQLVNWLSFLNALGDAFVFANNGVVLCPCEPPPETWEQSFDFTSDAFATFWSLSGFGSYSAGNGYQSQYRSSDQRDLLYLRCDPNIPFVVTYVEVFFSNANANWSSAGTFNVITGDSITPNSRFYENDVTGAMVQSSYVEYDNVTPLECEALNFPNIPRNNNTRYYITGCTLRGNGANPFD